MVLLFTSATVLAEWSGRKAQQVRKGRRVIPVTQERKVLKAQPEQPERRVRPVRRVPSGHREPLGRRAIPDCKEQPGRKAPRVRRGRQDPQAPPAQPELQEQLARKGRRVTPEMLARLVRMVRLAQQVRQGLQDPQGRPEQPVHKAFRESKATLATQGPKVPQERRELQAQPAQPERRAFRELKATRVIPARQVRKVPQEQRAPLVRKARREFKARPARPGARYSGASRNRRFDPRRADRALVGIAFGYPKRMASLRWSGRNAGSSGQVCKGSVGGRESRRDRRWNVHAARDGAAGHVLRFARHNVCGERRNASRHQQRSGIHRHAGDSYGICRCSDVHRKCGAGHVGNKRGNASRNELRAGIYGQRINRSEHDRGAQVSHSEHEHWSRAGHYSSRNGGCASLHRQRARDAYAHAHAGRHQQRSGAHDERLHARGNGRGADLQRFSSGDAYAHAHARWHDQRAGIHRNAGQPGAGILRDGFHYEAVGEERE
jgi:hypothetical protein